jgi:hypothetical protein
MIAQILQLYYYWLYLLIELYKSWAQVTWVTQFCIVVHSICVEVAFCHPSGAQNFEVAPRKFVYPCLLVCMEIWLSCVCLFSILHEELYDYTFTEISVIHNKSAFPTNAHHLLHEIFTILAYMFRFHGPSSGQLYKEHWGTVTDYTYKPCLWCVVNSVKSNVCVQRWNHH